MSSQQFLMPPALRGKSSIYKAMSELAAQHNAVDLAQGFSRLTVPGTDAVLLHAANALREGSQNYTDPNGLASLRASLAANTKRRFWVELDPIEQVTVCAGAQDALGAAMLGLLSPGDEVVFIEPFYNPVVPLARLTGATLRFVSLLQDDGSYCLNEDSLRQEMSERTKLIVYNSPNSPSGHVFTRNELLIVARACEHYDAYLIADEVYEFLVYDEHRHVSALEIPELSERAVVISSLSKSYLLTGWRVGWAQGARPLVAGIAKMHSLLSFCLPAFVSEGARYALDELPDTFLDELQSIHLSKRDRLCDNLSDLGFNISRPEGTFFATLDIGELDAGDDLAFCLAMPESLGVAGVPMSLSFSQRRMGKNLVRLCFSRSDEELDKAVSAFANWKRA